MNAIELEVAYTELANAIEPVLAAIAQAERLSKASS
jgi:hypothetical protein